MFKEFWLKVSPNSTGKRDKSSEFSRFFREATSREKKKVFLDVAKRASREQLETIQSVRSLSKI